MKAQWVCNNEAVHMANHRVALPWECSQLLGVCNVKTSWWEVENSKRKEVLSCRALHPRDYFLTEIESALFTISIKLGTPVNHMRCSPVISLLLLLPAADDICVRDTGNVWELLLLHQLPLLWPCCWAYQWQLPTFPAPGEKENFLKTLNSKVPSPLASLQQRLLISEAWSELGKLLEKSKRSATATPILCMKIFSNNFRNLFARRLISLSSGQSLWLCACALVTERGLAGWKVFAHSSTCKSRWRLHILLKSFNLQEEKIHASCIWNANF